LFFTKNGGLLEKWGWSFSKWLAKWMDPILEAKLTLHG